LKNVIAFHDLWTELVPVTKEHLLIIATGQSPNLSLRLTGPLSFEM
jgi:hypothetical protein